MSGSPNLHSSYDVVILGAGMAGLAAAYKLSQHGKSVLVLEKEAEVGGLSRTLQIGEFQFDYCAHRFHTPDPKLLKEVKEVMAENFTSHIQKSRIFMFGKYLKYPFELQNLLRGMPPVQAFLCGIDFLWNTIKRKLGYKLPTNNYRDWFITFFGKRLYRVMCEPYTRKIWGMDPGLISSDWANQRFQGANLAKLIKKVFQKLLRMDFSSYNLEDEELAPDGGKFYYPIVGGIQAMPERFKTLTEEKHGHVVTSVTITHVDPKAKAVTFTLGGHTHTIHAKESIISTVPLQVYLKLTKEPIPEKVQKAAEGLRYMDIVFVMLFINKPHISNDTWLYYPDRSIACNRAVEFKNWSKTMAPADRTSLCLDITVTPENTHFWTMGDKELIAKCAKDCEDTGLCKASEVYDGKVIRVPFAYPVYDLDYREKLTTLVEYIEKDEGIYCLGRTGIFRYQNSDGSIDSAFELSKRLLDPNEKQKSIFRYSMEGVSY